MLILTYIPIDEDHESAVQVENTVDVQMTEEGVQFYEAKTKLKRTVTYDKLVKIEFIVDISQGLRNKAINLSRLREANDARKPSYGRATVK